jgi:hypothetical protein
MSGHSHRTLLFRRATMSLSTAAFLCLWTCESRLCQAQTTASDQSQVTLKVKNDFKENTNRLQPLTMRLWSEKPWNPDSPMREEVIRPGRTASIDLLSPDRYTIEVQWKNNVWRSLPMHLKKAVKENPDKVLQLSLLYAAPITTKEIPPGMEMNFVSAKPNRSDPWNREVSKDVHQMFSEPDNWRRTIEFRNEYRDADGKVQAVEVRMRSERPLTAPGAQPSPGVKLDINAGETDEINLISPDPFTVEIVAAGKVYSATGLHVKGALLGSEALDHRAFFQVGSLANSAEPTLTLQNPDDAEFRDVKSNRPMDLLHQVKKPPKK